MADNLTPSPRRLDGAALDRVLARAAELQSSFANSADPSDTLSEEQIIELGREAGLSPEHLRQAIAEERTRGASSEERGLAASIFGPTRVQGSRVVIGRPGELLDVIDGWMHTEEGLHIKRRVGDRIVWEPRQDLFGSLRRALNVGGRGYALTRAEEVAATVTSVDASRSLVAIDATLANHRTRQVGAAGVVSTVAVAASGVAVVLSFPLLLAVAPAILAPIAGISFVRQIHAHALVRGQLAIDQLLDHLERGDHRRPGGMLGAISATAAALQGLR